MIALVFSAPPGDKKRTRAGIDLAMTLATFETEFELYFVGAAADCLAPDERPKSASRLLASLPLYGLAQWYCDRAVENALDGTQTLTPSAIHQRIRQCQQVIRV